MKKEVITALVTPMDNEGIIDYKSLDKLLKQQIDALVDGVVISGTTGEGSLLTIDEKITLIKYVINFVNNFSVSDAKTKVYVGVSSASTVTACEYVTKLNEISGIAALLVLTPYYIKPTQEGLYNHFKQVSLASNKPIILYNVPSRTGCDLADDTTLRLGVEFENIIGIKDATGDMERCKYLVQNRSPNFLLYSGDDKTALEFILAGGNGVVSVASNVVPDKLKQMFMHATTHVEQAKQIDASLANLYDALFVEANPIPVKWALFQQKIIASPNLRLPLTILNSNKHALVKSALM